MKAQYSWDELEKLLSEAGFLVYEHLNADEATELSFRIITAATWSIV